MLSTEEDGLNTLSINGQEVLHINGKNMPNAAEFTEEASNQGITFQLRHPVFYERMQIGITTNPSVNAIHLLVDNVRARVSD
ncbi:MAG: hypothetical protein AAF840_11380 [Bacteroidota bacterium]